MSLHSASEVPAVSQCGVSPSVHGGWKGLHGILWPLAGVYTAKGSP